jgi:PilZ domain-containing protein
MSSNQKSNDRRKFKRFDSKKIKDIKVFKEKDKEGNTDGYTVKVDFIGYSVNQRFNDIKSAFSFIKELELEDDQCDFYRKHNRVHSLNVIYYICIDKDGAEISQGMGRTLNISEGGILLETYIPIDPQYSLLLSIDTEVDLIRDIKANVIYCNAKGKGRYESGIAFLEKNKVANQLVDKHLSALQDQINTNT